MNLRKELTLIGWLVRVKMSESAAEKHYYAGFATVTEAENAVSNLPGISIIQASVLRTLSEQEIKEARLGFAEVLEHGSSS